MIKKYFTLRTTMPEPLESSSVLQIKEYYLQFSTHNSFTHSQNERVSIYMLGNIFDYIDTTASNQDLLNTLMKQKNLEHFFKALDKFYGEYVMIYASDEAFIVLNDCCAQKEIYYTNDYSEIGSELSLISKQNEPEENHAYYSSRLYNKKQLLVGTTTPSSNVKHLAPNHYIDLKDYKTVRFFPNSKNQIQDLDVVAERAALMLKGYIKAISHRHSMVLPVTGGFDSRVLFLASLQTPCDYFVFKHQNMNKDHYDLKISKTITDLYSKTLQIFREDKSLETSKGQAHDMDPEFKEFAAGKVLINGNISEVARNFFNYISPVTSQKLTLLNGFSNNIFVVNVYEDWLSQNQTLITEYQYNLLDFFYWEEKMGNWAAKTKTVKKDELFEIMSPFNSRALLKLLLSTQRKERDKLTSPLYKKIIRNLVDNHKEVNNIPVNPDFMRFRDILLKKVRAFNLFDALRLELRMLKRKF